MSHTPGPWTVSPLGGKYYGTNINVGDAEVSVWTSWYPNWKPSEREIADGWVPDHGVNHVESERDLANARLIAAAPDLLDALETLGSCSAAYVEGHPVFEEALRAAQAAIAKAKGKA